MSEENKNSEFSFENESYRKTYWHTCSHILAQAVKRLYPEVKLAIGPSIDEGFYYDMDSPFPFTPEILEKLEGEMRKICKEKLKLERFELPREEALKFMEEKGEPYKVELIHDLPEDAHISFYKQGEFTDLCAGPHLDSTGRVKGNAIKLTACNAAYWRGDSSRQTLQRIYGIAFPKKDELDAYLQRIEEAKKRDHRRLGKELGLFTIMDEGPGFPFFLPKGMVLKNTLIDYWRQVHKRYGYVEISTPIMLNRSLWERSGHWDHYKNNMYTTVIDEEDFAVKPMNCPGGMLVYKNEPHSYRDLPLRVGELGLVHRHELSGALHGLFRVRCFTQDDAHIFMTPDQLKDEINRIADSANFNGIKLLDGSMSSAGKATAAGDLEFAATKAVTGSSTSGAFVDAAADMKAGKTVSYTVSWKDEAGTEHSKTVDLTMSDDQTKLVAADGTEYDLQAKKPTKTELGQAFLAELKKDSTLNASFDISLNTDALTFTSKTAGASGATITALGMKSSDTTAFTDTQLAAGKINGTKTKVGLDSMQVVDFSGVGVVDGSKAVTAEDAAKNIFEIDGHKFLFAKNGSTAENLKDVGSDVTVITLAADTYSGQNDGANVAATINRVTGMDLKYNKVENQDAGIAQYDITYSGEKKLSTTGDDNSLVLQIGDTSDSWNQLKVSIEDCHTTALGIDALDIGNQVGAGAALDTIKNAINYVSDVRGTLGATQNRLDHTINNLSVMEENIQDAESTIRDTDVADEMMAYTKNNILIQSAQAMLAQANQVPQGVLQLLQ